MQLRAPKDAIASGPDGGRGPYLLAPWQAGLDLVVAGDCGWYIREGDHENFGGKWTDDRFAVDVGLCGAADLGKPVVAATNGTVRVAGTQAGYGSTVVIEKTTNGFATRYAHLDGRPIVHVGQRVAAGQQIGTIGYSGLVGQTDSASHLHVVLYSSRRRSAGLRIKSLSGQRVEDNRQIRGTGSAPGAPLKPVTHYSCDEVAFPAGSFLSPGQRYVQPFVARGSQIAGGTIAAVAPYNDFAVGARATLGVYRQADTSPTNTVGVVPLLAREPQHASDYAQSTFAFDVPITVQPGTTYFMILTAQDQVSFYRNGPQGDACLIGAITGYRE